MMHMGLVFRISLRHFFTREKRSSHHLRGAAMGIGIAVIPVIIALIAGNGLIEGITVRFQELSSGQLQIRGLKTRNDVSLVLDQVRNLDGVRFAGECIEQYGLLSTGKKNAGAAIRGLPANVFEQDDGFRSYITVVDGDFILTDPQSIVVSEELAKRLSLKAGSDVKLIIGRQFGNRILYRPTTFSISGIVSTGYYELDSMTVYASHDRVRKLFGPDLSGYIIVKTGENMMGDVQKRIREAVSSRYSVLPWYMINSSLFDNFSSTKSSLLVILLLIVAIAGVSVSSSVYMLVMEQKEEIAFLKAVGMSNRTVSHVFLLSGGITGLIGGICGVFAGLLTGIHINGILAIIEVLLNTGRKIMTGLLDLSSGIPGITIVGSDFYLDQIPVIIHYHEVLMVLAVGIFVSLAGALIPAIKASRIPPLEMISKK